MGEWESFHKMYAGIFLYMNRFLWSKDESFDDNNQNDVIRSEHADSDFQPRKSQPLRSGKLYFLMILLANMGIWGTTLTYATVAKPTYTSEWSITIPGTASTTNINLPNIGQANAQNYSAYASASYDPRENYKAIATSDRVIQAAAGASNIPVEKFGTPRIKIVDNTTLMRFEMVGDTPEEAQKKSQALYDALQARLVDLRQEEVRQQSQRLQTSIDDLRQKLKRSQARLSNYQALSGLSSEQQLIELANNIEELRRQRSELSAQARQFSERTQQLSANLQLSPQQASDGFVLQADPVFQKYFQEYSLVKSKLIASNAKFLPNHPSVINQQSERSQAEASLKNRVRQLLGRDLSLASIEKLNLSGGEAGGKRSTFSEQLITSNTEKAAINEQIRGLDDQIKQLEQRLRMLAQRKTTLEDLKRDVQVSEAVFSSAIAQMDLSKSTVSVSYPQIQVLSAPKLPDNAVSPKKNLVFFGGAGGSIFISIGLLALHQQVNNDKPRRKLQPVNEIG